MAEGVAGARALVFDVEGTLIDCVAGTLDCWEETLAEVGQSVSRATLQSYSGCDGGVMLESLLPRLSGRERAKVLRRHARLYVHRYLNLARAIPGMHELFATLKRRGYLLALATTCQRVELDHYDRLLDVRRFCSAVECGSAIKRGKPYPDLFQAALKTLRIAAAQAVAIGDTPYDAAAAGACGMAAVGVLTGGFTTASLTAAGCASVLDDATLLAKVLLPAI
jgi:HAD superfamily hydrolase (TIGR01509 family)